ncbi:MAG TPA: tetratricopeptide repeat protein [Planctomycetota bacterium]|nr:tetratricopeptide repeat protein [Planctomycetota bacterium]
MTTTRFKVSGGNDARVKELRGILERDPLNVNQRFMLAQALESDGKLADAVKELGVAIEKGRRNLGVAHCNYAMGLMKINKPEEALRHFDLAIETDPSNASFYLNNKASALTQIGLHDKARAIYAQILDRKDLSKETQRIVIKRVADMRQAPKK